MKRVLIVLYINLIFWWLFAALFWLMERHCLLINFFVIIKICKFNSIATSLVNLFYVGWSFFNLSLWWSCFLLFRGSRSWSWSWCWSLCFFLGRSRCFFFFLGSWGSFLFFGLCSWSFLGFSSWSSFFFSWLACWSFLFLVSCTSSLLLLFFL